LSPVKGWRGTDETASPFRASYALLLSYKQACACLAGFAPATLRLTKEQISSPPPCPRASLRRAMKCWGTGDFGFSDRNAEPLFRKVRSPRRTSPREADSTARSTAGGCRTRFTLCEVSEIFTTSVRYAAHRGRVSRGTAELRRPDGLRWQTKYRSSSPPRTERRKRGKPNLKINNVATLS
jgi:hypothetical protein